MSDTGDNNTLVAHLEALRGALLRIVAATALLLPATYWAAPYVTRWLTRWCFDKQGTLYYFSPMEAFWVQLKLALVMALVVAYPWNALQVWRFVLPALYPRERRAIGRWVLLSSLLFFAGGAFCVGGILPIVMRFSESFSSAELRPMIGLAGFLDLAGWLTIAFALMFQTPIAVYLLVRMDLVAAAAVCGGGDTGRFRAGHAARRGEPAAAGGADLAALRGRAAARAGGGTAHRRVKCKIRIPA